MVNGLLKDILSTLTVEKKGCILSRHGGIVDGFTGSYGIDSYDVSVSDVERLKVFFTGTPVLNMPSIGDRIKFRVPIIPIISDGYKKAFGLEIMGRYYIDEGAGI